MINVYLVAIATATAAIGQTSNVTYQSTISTGLAYPARLAPGPAGGFYITDPPAKQVLYYDVTGLLPPVKYAVAEGPVGIAVHSDGRVFLSRNDGKIGVYTAGFLLQSLVNPTPRVLSGPNDLAFDIGANELYAVDSGGHQVLVFRESGGNWTLNRSWGMEGPGLGQYESPQAIALDTALGHVIVTDVDNFRVQVFDAFGIPQFKFGYRTLFTTVTNDSCVRAGAPWTCCTGWRTGTCGTASEVAWFARSEGVAVDACSNIYISDALMGTVRVFSKTGNELDAAHQPVIGYGAGPDSLRVPCDLMVNTGKLYVADTNDGAIELYGVTCTSAAASAGGDAVVRSAKEQRYRGLGRSGGSNLVQTDVLLMPDNPAEIVVAMNAGEFREDLDLNRDQVLDMRDLEIAVTHFGAGTVENFLNDGEVASQVATHDALVPPHIIDIANRCGRCHSMDGAPEGGILPALGQENLCQSCHSAGKIAGKAWVGPGSLGNSHPWDELADEGVSNGPMTGVQKNATCTGDQEPWVCCTGLGTGNCSSAACTGAGAPWACCTGAGTGTCFDSELLLHLDSGKIRCGTCHDPHENRPVGTCVTGVCEGGPFDGSVCKNGSDCAAKVKFMREEIYHGEDKMASQGGSPAVYARKRMTVMDPTLCGECHTEIAAEWRTVGHADTEADPWSHYDWGMGNNWLCTGPGTPKAYCTDVGAGTAASASAAVCTGPTTPLACCSGNGTGTCTLPQAMCTGVGTPEPCCTGVGTGSCSDRSSCRQCHSGNGYIDFSKDFPDGTVVLSTHRGGLRVIDCLVCHATHGESQDGKLLRIYDTIRLPTGQVFNNVGAGATCMSCHNGRSIPTMNPSSVSTPHYLNGAATLEGINAMDFFPAGPNPNAECTAAGLKGTTPRACCTGAGAGNCTSQSCTGAGAPWPCCTGAGAGTCPTTNATCTGLRTPLWCCTGVGTGTCPSTNALCTGAGTPWACCTGAGAGSCPTMYTLSNSSHTTNADCTTCHMAPGPTSGPEVGKVGEHTFRMMDPATDYDNVGACNAVGCHGGAPLVGDFDRVAPVAVLPECTGAGAPVACCTALGTGTCEDYDGNGTIAGVQTETAGLLELLKDALYAAGASRLLVNPNTGLAGTEAGVCTGLGTPLACCTGVRTGPTCADPDANPTNPYWTLRRCLGGTRDGLACNSATPTAPFDCPGGGTCPQIVPTTNSRASTVINGIWNWEFVDNSGDFGVHNTGYEIGVLQAAYKGVTGFPVPRVDLCTAASTPWACCTGAGAGTCATQTGYRYSPAP